MTEGLLTLTTDAFSLISEHLDGRDGAALRATCNQMRSLVGCNENLSGKIHIHLVALTKIEDLQRVVSVNPLKQLGTADMWLENILWFVFRINAISVNLDTFDKVLKGICRGEGGRFYQDIVTNDIIYCNNHYGSHLHRCYTRDDAFEWPDSRYFYHECTPSEHVVEQIERINELLPGFIKNYKLIDFPFQSKGRYHLVKDDWGMHRGTCECITFNTYGITGVRSIHKNLQRMKKAEPSRCFESGQGKKRKFVQLEEPPLHPVSKLDVVKCCGKIVSSTEEGASYHSERKYLKHHKSHGG